jgi:hypothetical protein
VTAVRIDAGTRRRVGAYLVGLVAVVWVLVGVVLVTLIGSDLLDHYLDDQSCPVPGLDSVYGESSWQVWPPGHVCTFGAARLEEPGAARGAAIVFEVLVGIGLFLVWHRSRDAPDPDWAA